MAAVVTKVFYDGIYKFSSAIAAAASKINGVVGFN